MNIYKIQKDFADYINNNNDIIKTYITTDYYQNLTIYSNNVVQNLTDILDQTYQYTKLLIGEECFSQLTELYIQEHTATSGNLDDYGENFANFINEKLSGKLPYIKDISMIEWMLQLSMNQVNNYTDNSKIMSNNAEELAQIKFKLHPATFFFQSNYAIYDIWQLVTEKSNFTENINYQLKKENIAIIKQGCSPIVTPISMQEYSFLSMISDHHTLLDIFNMLEENTELFQKILLKFINHIDTVNP